MFFSTLFSLCERKTVSVYYWESNNSYTYQFGKYDLLAVGRGIYEDTYQNRGGWKQLHIEASNFNNDDVMAYATGYAEGLLTQPIFENHYKNTIAALCHDFIPDCIDAYTLPSNVTQFFENNYNWVVNNITNSPMDREYQWGANITMSQFQGVYDGYVEGCRLTGSTPITIIDFWIYQCRSEINDVYRGLFPQHSVDPRLLLDRRGSFVLSRKSYDELFIAHSSWRSYAEATRIAKRYRIDFKHISNVVARKTFASYPLMLHADGGLTITDQGLIIAATSIMIDEYSMYKYLDYRGFPHWLREVSADQTSHTAYDWSDTYSQISANTSGVEWIVINLKRFVTATQLFKSGGILSHFINVIEEIPSTIVYTDLSDYMRNQTYFGSFDVPFDPYIYIQAGYNKRQQTDPELYSLTNSSRARLLAEKFSSLNTRDKVRNFIRFNDINDDNQLNRTDLGISPREENTSDEPKLCRGAIDSVYTDIPRALHLEWDGIVGPFYNGNDPYKAFKFDDYESCNGIIHEGVPDEFRFNWFGNYFDLDV